MAQPLQVINLIAPAFKGVNTEDSPLAQDPSFAEVADNAIIDEKGRIASRKGNDVLTTDKTELGTDYIHKLHFFYDNNGNEKLFSVGNNKILSGTTTLVDETPATYVVTGDNWQMFNFNNAAYFFQRGHEPLIYTNSGGLQTFSAYNTANSLPGISSSQHCNAAIGAYGRVWCADAGADRQTVYWSDLLVGTDFSGGSSGSVNISKVWPDGFDEIKGLAAHNGLLIIFGEHSTIVFGGAEEPATMQLVDTIPGIGLSCRNSIQHIGTDVLFTAPSGLRSLGRVIQEKSMPISDLSANIRTTLISQISNRVLPTSSLYSPEHSFYLLTFPDQNITWCFDVRVRLENNAYRVTKWPAAFTAWERAPDGTIYIGSSEGVGIYRNYTDNDESYRFRYYSPALTFQDSSRLKILKELRPTIVGANGAQVQVKWGYTFGEDFETAVIDLSSSSVSRWGIDQWGIATWSEGILISREVIDADGDGSIVRVGIESDISANALSLQEINVLALLGRLT